MNAYFISGLRTDKRIFAKLKLTANIKMIQDKILYLKNATPDFGLENRTHFMVYQQAEEISAIMNKLIFNIATLDKTTTHNYEQAKRNQMNLG